MSGWINSFMGRWRLWQLETRVLASAIAASLGSGLLMVVASCTNHWADLSLMTEDGVNLVGCQGLWKIKYHVGAKTYDYVLVHLFGSGLKRQLDDHVTTMLRTAVSFVGMSLLMLVLSNLFAVYSLRNPRFTFKRAAAALFGLTMACQIVCIDVYSRILRAEQADRKLIKFPRELMTSIGASPMPTTAAAVSDARGPDQAPRARVLVRVLSWSFGYSLAFVIASAVVSGLAACLFLLYSRKLKEDRAPDRKTAEANEEVLIGRV